MSTTTIERAARPHLEACAERVILRELPGSPSMYLLRVRRREPVHLAGLPAARGDGGGDRGRAGAGAGALAGRRLVFLHGWGLGPRSYLPVLKPLAAHLDEVVLLALPGFAGSDPLPLRRDAISRGVEATAIRVEAALRHLAATRPGVVFDLAGHSFGGATALHLASASTATSPTTRASGANGTGADRPLVASVLLASPAGAFEHHLPAPHRVAGGLLADAVHTWTPRALADLGPNLLRHPLAVATQGLAALVSDQVDQVSAVTAAGTPVTMLLAEHDDVVTTGRFADLADLADTTRAAHTARATRTAHTARMGAVGRLVVQTVPGKHSWLLTDPARFRELALAHLHGAAADSRRTA